MTQTKMNYAVLDLETTGLSPIHDEPVQISFIIVNSEGKQVEAHNYYVATKVLIHAKAFAVHRITAEVLKEFGVLPSVAASIYHKAIWRHQPCTLLGYNLINFDLPMLMNFLKRYMPGPFPFPPITQIKDVMFLFRDYKRTTKWTKLADAAKEFNISFEKSDLHSAMEDVRLTWEIYKQLEERRRA